MAAGRDITYQESYYQLLKKKSEFEASFMLRNCKNLRGPDKKRLRAGGCITIAYKDMKCYMVSDNNHTYKL
jgi:hypothetical protein